MAVSTDLPTLYEYYTGGGINAGLSVDQPYFTLNEKNITLYSGAMHYFRVPKPYWRDRLRKMRAAGLNAVETYVPWNLHEPQNGTYDFGDGGSDMQDFLDVREFFKIVQEEDLFALVRSGPYICSEFEFGGLPSWLLRERDIKVRTSDSIYMKYVTRYFNMLLPILALFQFSTGGSIIGFQIENEYGSTNQPGTFTPDKEYLRQLQDLLLDNGVRELLFTSDGITGSRDTGMLPGILGTANFANDPESQFNALKAIQPDKPIMAMEYWTGWFDHWTETHHTRNNDDFRDTLERILNYPASVNMYMFHGGTTWGFLNGANAGNDGTDNSALQPDTTSYDYDAPLSETGDYTEKYVIVQETIKKFNKVETRLPDAPDETPRIAYPNVTVTDRLFFNEFIDQIDEIIEMPEVTAMELLPINNNSGQSYGYVVYRKAHVNIPSNAVLTIEGHVADTVIVLVNGIMISKALTQQSDLNGFGYWRQKDSNLTLGQNSLTDATLELIVENWGRVNFGHLEQYYQFKGLFQGSVYINNAKLSNWQIAPLEFKKQWTNSLQGWHGSLVTIPVVGPCLYKASFQVVNPQDTYLDMRAWTKGIVIINGFVLGKYAIIGPQQTLYLPAPLLREGQNDIVIFEHFAASNRIVFSENPIFQTSA